MGRAGTPEEFKKVEEFYDKEDSRRSE